MEGRNSHTNIAHKLGTNKYHLERGTSVDEFMTSDWPLGKSVEHFIDSDCCGRAQTTVSGATFGQVVLVCIKNKHAKPQSSTHSSVVPFQLLSWGSCTEFLYWLSSMMDSNL